MSEFKREWLEKDYYKTLGVERTASQKDITKTYRKLARKYHPDTNPSPKAEDKFKEISAAYSVLSNPKTRGDYDEMQKLGMFQSGPQASQDGGVFFETDDLRQGLGGFFTRSGGNSVFNFGRNWPRDGQDVVKRAEISFDEAIRGKELKVRINGKSSKNLIRVRVPPLVEDGSLVKARGKGKPGSNGGRDGDLLVRVKVGKHPVFERDGLNLKMTRKINFAEAALGGNVTISTYSGESATIAIPPGTQSGQTLRLRNKGLKKGDQTGDLFVKIQIDVPTSLTRQQRRAVAALAEAFHIPVPDDLSSLKSSLNSE